MSFFLRYSSSLVINFRIFLSNFRIFCLFHLRIPDSAHMFVSNIMFLRFNFDYNTDFNLLWYSLPNSSRISIFLILPASSISKSSYPFSFKMSVITLTPGNIIPCADKVSLPFFACIDSLLYSKFYSFVSLTKEYPVCRLPEQFKFMKEKKTMV